MSSVVLWVLVLFETGLLLLLLRALGQLKQQGTLTVNRGMPLENWGLAVGEQAPSFEAIDDNGKQVRLEDYQGQRCVLAFISPGCSACAGAIEALNLVMQEDRGPAVLVLGSADYESNRQYATEHKASIQILTPNSSQINDMYRIRGVPFVFVLDERGVIRAKGTVNMFEHLHELLTTAFAPMPVSR